MTKLADQGTPNRFIEIPKFDKEVWDSVQAMHPKTLAVSILGMHAKSTEYTSLTADVCDMAHSDSTPLHHRIALWHAAHNGDKLEIDISDCKNIFLPRQRLLNKIDPGNHRPLEEVRAEVEGYAEVFFALYSDGDEEHRKMTLREMLDAAEAFHVVSYRSETWSAVPVSCSCKHGYKWTLCGHSALVSMMFDDEIVVPSLWDQASPSLRKARGRRGIVTIVGVGKGRGLAGVKRVNLERVIEQDKQVGRRKAKAMRIEGPVMLAIASLLSNG
jgi:hypothetical protein